MKVDHPELNGPESAEKAVIPEKLQRIFDFIDFMKSHVDLARDYGVETWAEVELLACHSATRVPGLGTELIARGVQKLREDGVEVIKMKRIKRINHSNSSLFNS